MRRGEEALQPVCRLKLMSHGRPTSRVVVLLHGLTNCPQQFESLGREIYARGANVLIPPLPRHGLADRMTDALGNLTAEELARSADQAVDVARGLGDSITVSGLSVGAVSVVWIAQHRADVDRAVSIAPMLGVPHLWPPLTPAAARLLARMPNRFVWWDRKRREAVLGPPQVYPRFSSRALAQTLRLGLAVSAQARREPLQAASVTFVTVEKDPAISNAAVRLLESRWRRLAPDRVSSHEFPRRIMPGHDLIDPLQPYQRTEVVYPVLTDLMWSGRP
jgi:alpha-beta hydrolase superfamily lysophospholipase